MSFFKKLFGKKQQQIQINRNRYAEFGNGLNSIKRIFTVLWMS